MSLQKTTARPAAWIWLACLCFYLLLGTRERPWGDATPIFQVAQHLVRSGTVAISIRWPPQQERGRFGHYYAVNPALTSAVHIPGAALYEGLTKLFPDPEGRALPLATQLGPAAMGALVCSLFFLICQALGCSFRSALTATIMVGSATTIFVYARSAYSEITQAAAYMATLYSLVLLRRQPTARAAAYVGLCLGALINTKIVFVVALPGLAGLVAVWAHVRFNLRTSLKLLAWMALGFVPGLALTLLYNWVRFGSLFSTGYGEFLPGSMLGAVWGMLLSPGKSVFLYSPPLLLALLGLAKLIKQARFLCAAIAVSMIPVVLVHARLPCWSGDYAWGPRYLVFAVPAACLPLGLWLDSLGAGHRRVSVILVTALGVSVQILGGAFHWDHFIRVMREARPQLIGTVEGLELDLDTAAGRKEGCFSDSFPLQWLPAFQPIAGHFWLLKSRILGKDWKSAEAQAPWRPFTSRNLEISYSYDRVRIDWWPLDWQPLWAGGWGLVLAFGLDTARRRLSPP